MPVPNIAGKSAFASVYGADDFVAHLRANGWDPGPLPVAVIFTYGGFDQVCAAAPDEYSMNPMLGPGPGRFFGVVSSGGRVGVCCMGIGAPAVVAQMEVLVALGVRRFLSIGTAGELGPDQTPGDVVLLTGAVRDEGASYHYAAPDDAVGPDPGLTASLEHALRRAGMAPVSGSTWTTDAPYRQSAEEIAELRAEGVLTVEMEAAALFAVAGARRVPLASAVVLDAVYPEPITSPRMDRAVAYGRLAEVFRVSVELLAGPA